LPARGGDKFWKWISNFERVRDLDVGSGHTAYRRTSLIDLYLHAKFHWNQINFWWTNRRTYGRTIETHLLGGLRRVELINTENYSQIWSTCTMSGLETASTIQPIATTLYNEAKQIQTKFSAGYGEVPRQHGPLLYMLGVRDGSLIDTVDAPLNGVEDDGIIPCFRHRGGSTADTPTPGEWRWRQLVKWNWLCIHLRLT